MRVERRGDGDGDGGCAQCPSHAGWVVRRERQRRTRNVSSVNQQDYEDYAGQHNGKQTKASKQTNKQKNDVVYAVATRKNDTVPETIAFEPCNTTTVSPATQCFNRLASAMAFATSSSKVKDSTITSAKVFFK